MGQFVELRDLLPDNIALVGQLNTLHGLSTSHLVGPLRPCLPEVLFLASWMYWLSRHHLAYTQLIVREAQLHGGTGWLDYDKRVQTTGSIGSYIAMEFPPASTALNRLKQSNKPLQYLSGARRSCSPMCTLHAPAANYCNPSPCCSSYLVVPAPPSMT